MKFEYVFCSRLGENVYLGDVSEWYNFNTTAFLENYNYLFCPECRQAKITYNNAKTPYFSTHKNCVHKENCYYIQDALTGKATKNFVDDTANDENIKNQMKKALIDFMKEPSHKNKVLQNNKENESEKQNNVGSKNSKASKALHRKSLNKKFDDDDYDCFKIFYGKFNIEWEYKNENCKTFYNLLLRDLNTNRLMYKIKVTLPVYEHLPKEYKAENQFIGYIVITVSFSNESKSRNYKFSTLFRSNLLLIEKDVTQKK